MRDAGAAVEVGVLGMRGNLLHGAAGAGRGSASVGRPSPCEKQFNMVLIAVSALWINARYQFDLELRRMGWPTASSTPAKKALLCAEAARVFMWWLHAPRSCYPR
ncbi:hypothetical protein D3C72_1645420 [compost metagenome]